MIERHKRNFNKEACWIYLAGPFFNVRQKEWARRLTDTLTKRGYLCYAPVEHAWLEKDPQKNATEIFERNIKWIKDCSLVLAQLDYLLEENKELGIATMISNSTEFSGQANRFEPVHLPDPGTIWEMGYAFSKNIPVIGYTLEKGVALNLMLAQGLIGYIENPLEVFESQGIRWNLVKEWKGKKI